MTDVSVHPFYSDHKLRTHEVQKGLKYPSVNGWQTTQKTCEEVDLALCSEAYNKYGWILDDNHFVVDIDVHNAEADGYASLAKLESAIGLSLGKACRATVDTPSGGRHFYFEKPEGLVLHRTYTAYPGIDFLDGSQSKQVIAAGSCHDDYEGTYTFQQVNPQLDEAPAELVRHLMTLGNRGDKERADPLRTDRVGDIFMQSWEGVEYLKEAMEDAGYTFRMADDYYEYDRPGKTTNSERSGHLGKQSEHGNYHLTSFTLSDPTFPSGEAITIFRAFSMLCCDGDEANATRRLSTRFNPQKQAADVFERIVQGEKPRQDDPNVLKPRPILDVIADNPHTRPFVIDGLLRQGEVMNLIASPKVGKSWLLNQLLMGVATGSNFIGHDTRASRVLLVDNELHPETQAERARKVAVAICAGSMLKDHFDVLNLRGSQKDIISLASTFASFGHGYYGLIAIDAMYRTWPPGMSENSNADVTNYYNMVDHYARMTGAAIVLVHHTSKGGQSDKEVTDVGAGAGAISRAADTHLTLRPHEEEGYVVLDSVCRSCPSPKPKTLKFDFPIWSHEEQMMAVLEDKQSKNRADKDAQLKDKIVEELGKGPSNVKTLRGILGTGQDRMDRCLYQLERSGVVKSVEGEKMNNGYTPITWSLIDDTYLEFLK